MNARLKCLLFLIVGLCLGVALRPLVEPAPARAMAMGGGMPSPVFVPSLATPSLAATNGIAYVVSGGKIAAYEVRDHKLTQAGESLAIPEPQFAPESPHIQ